MDVIVEMADGNLEVRDLPFVVQDGNVGVANPNAEIPDLDVEVLDPKCEVSDGNVGVHYLGVSIAGFDDLIRDPGEPVHDLEIRIGDLDVELSDGGFEIRDTECGVAYVGSGPAPPAALEKLKDLTNVRPRLRSARIGPWILESVRSVSVSERRRTGSNSNR